MHPCPPLNLFELYHVSTTVSVVIICRNAMHTIDRALQSALRLTEDVVVIDTGSTDGTPEHVQHYPVQLHQQAWMGYGLTKNLGNRLAKHPWIMSMDADEELSDELIKAIQRLRLHNETSIYSTRRLGYMGNKAIHHGNRGRDYTARLFNRNCTQWDASEVHEKLVCKSSPNQNRLDGVMHHYTAPCIQSFQLKLNHYACLMADKYLAAGKQVTPTKIVLSPVFGFLMHYVLWTGFLDGKEGWQIAKANARYTFQKYKLLQQKQKHLKNLMHRQIKQQQVFQ